MAETPYYKFRLPPAVLADLRALAASNGGNNTTAVKEAVSYWRAAVEHAATENARELKPADWTRLAHLNDPDPFPDLPDEVRAKIGGPTEGGAVLHWSARLARELVDMWEGRELLPAHRKEAAACRKLADKIRPWDLVRGYALFAALRHFWRHSDSGVGGGDWWAPEVWLTPTAKGKG